MKVSFTGRGDECEMVAIGGEARFDVYGACGRHLLSAAGLQVERPEFDGVVMVAGENDPAPVAGGRPSGGAGTGGQLREIHFPEVIGVGEIDLLEYGFALGEAGDAGEQEQASGTKPQEKSSGNARVTELAWQVTEILVREPE